MQWKIRPMVAVIGLAIVLRLAAMAVLPGSLLTDRDAYLGIARGVARGDGLCVPETRNPTAYRPPLYPLVLGAALTVAPEAVAVAMINLFSTVGIIWLVARWSQDVTTSPEGDLPADSDVNSWRSLWPAIAVAVDPLLILGTAQPMTESLCTALVVAAVALASPTAAVRGGLHSAEPGGSWRRAALCGFTLGLAALCRPTAWAWFALWGAGEVVVEWNRRRDGQFQLAAGRAFLRWSIALLVVLPWGLRNAVVFDSWLVTTTHGGYTILLANNETIFAEEVAHWGRRLWSSESLAAWNGRVAAEVARRSNGSTNEFVVDGVQKQLAWEYIAEHPRETVQSSVYRWLRFASWLPPADESRRLPTSVLWGIAVIYIAMWMLAGRGVWIVLTSSSLRSGWPAVTAIASFALVHCLFFANARMRAPVEPLLLAFACIGATIARRRNRNSHEKR